MCVDGKLGCLSLKMRQSGWPLAWLLYEQVMYAWEDICKEQNCWSVFYYQDLVSEVQSHVQHENKAKTVFITNQLCKSTQTRLALLVVIGKLGK